MTELERIERLEGEVRELKDKLQRLANIPVIAEDLNATVESKQAAIERALETVRPRRRVIDAEVRET